MDTVITEAKPDTTPKDKFLKPTMSRTRLEKIPSITIKNKEIWNEMKRKKSELKTIKQCNQHNGIKILQETNDYYRKQTKLLYEQEENISPANYSKNTLLVIKGIPEVTEPNAMKEDLRGQGYRI